MTKKFISETIREQAGQYTRVTDRAMINAGVERMGTCSFCGHKIRNHVGVQSPDGTLAWAGSDCASILCREDVVIDLDAGTVYKDDGREYVAVDAVFCDRLGRAAYSDWDKLSHSYCPTHYRSTSSQFLASLLKTARRYKALSRKQYDAAIKLL